jgi:hypothetical protein
VVAASFVKRFALPVAAAAAALFLTIFAFVGERPRDGSEPFKPQGVLAAWAMEEVTSIKINQGSGERLFTRDVGGPWRSSQSEVRPDVAAQIETGLRLLHNAATERELSHDDIRSSSMTQFGLETPKLILTARTAQGASVTLAFGELNPMGLAQYVRVDDRADIVMLPSYVGQAWDEAAAQK